MRDYDLAIKDVTLYLTKVVSIRDALNEGKTVSIDQRTNLQTDYEIFVRPHADAVEMHEPGEQEWHGYILRFDNPVEWAVKEGSFFSLNNAIVVLNRLVGRLEYYKTHPDQFLPAHGKPSIEPALLIDKARLSEVRALKVAGYDLTRLVCLCEELDYCYQVGAYHAVIMLTRAILDHVPPLFGCKNFAEVANNYAGTKSFKQSMDHLQGGARNIADLHLHGQVRAVESLPNATQVNFSQYLDPIRFS